MSLFCNKTFGISVNIINFLLDPTKKVSFDVVLCDKVETPVRQLIQWLSLISLKQYICRMRFNDDALLGNVT